MINMDFEMWILTGASETVLVLLGIFYFIKFLVDYMKYKKKLTPLLAFLALSLGSMHLGGAVAFLFRIISGIDISYITYGYLTYIPMPVGFVLAIYIAYEVFNPKLKWVMVGIHAALGVTLIVALVVFDRIPAITGSFLGTQMQEIEATDETLVDAGIQSVVGTIFTIFVISAVLALGFNFFQIRSKMNESESVMRKKSLLLGLGWIMWGLAEFFAKGQFDFIPTNYTIILNSITFAALVMIFLGFAPMKEE
jgi:hypothetical protein